MTRSTVTSRPWMVSWSGAWSILFLSHYVGVYTTGLRAATGRGMRYLVMVTRRGHSTGYIRVDDRRVFGLAAARKMRNVAGIRRWCQRWVAAGDAMQAFIRSHRTPTADARTLTRYFSLLETYARLHITAKNVIDFLDPATLKLVSRDLTRARVHTEHVYVDTEVFLRRFGAVLGRRLGLPSDLVLCMTKPEVFAAISGRRHPTRATLERRNRVYAVAALGGKTTMFVGAATERLERKVQRSGDQGTLEGATAYPGHATGRVRIIHHPTGRTPFTRGDILVTGMTRPEFVPLMRRAGAVVTDGGGLLSHAAIVARELKIPCVIGTTVATKVFKDGDQVEVDATKGIVRRYVQ